MSVMRRMAAAAAAILLITELPVAHADAPITYTVEPFLGGTFGINVTQQQFGGHYCPCAKIDYPSDGFHNQQGVDAINRVSFKAGDTLMGFSLGVQVISLYLSQHKLPAGVKVLLAGDTFARNQQLIDQNAGIPWDIDNDVKMVVNEFDGWSDSPTTPTLSNWYLAWQNAVAGTQWLHYYANAKPDDPANVVTHHGRITAVLIPTVHLPLNMGIRLVNPALADKLDEQERWRVDSAYLRQGSTAPQRAAAAAQQAPFPNPPWSSNSPEPAAATK